MSARDTDELRRIAGFFDAVGYGTSAAVVGAGADEIDDLRERVAALEASNAGWERVVEAMQGRSMTLDEFKAEFLGEVPDVGT